MRNRVLKDEIACGNECCETGEYSLWKRESSSIANNESTKIIIYFSNKTLKNIKVDLCSSPSFEALELPNEGNYEVFLCIFGKKRRLLKNMCMFVVEKE